MQNHSFKPDFKYETKKQLPSLSRRFPLTGTPWQEVMMITAFFVFNHYIFIIFCHSSGGFYLPKGYFFRNSSAMMYSARCFAVFCENPELCGAKRRFFAVSVHHLLRFSRRLNCNLNNVCLNRELLTETRRMPVRSYK